MNIRKAAELGSSLRFNQVVVESWSKTLWVDSSHTQASDLRNSGRDPDHPLKTIVKAIANGAAGDTIIVGAGHTETVSTATQMDFSKADMVVIGLGRANRRPTITLDTIIGAIITVSGAGVRLENLRIASGFDAITNLISVTGADCEFVDLEIVDDATYQAVLGFLIDAGADRCVIDGLKATQKTAGAASVIKDGGSTGSIIRKCWLVGDYSVGNIHAATGVRDILIEHNRLENLNAVDVNISMGGNQTGHIQYNTCRIVTDSELTWIGTSKGQLFENYGVNDDGQYGIQIGTTTV